MRHSFRTIVATIGAMGLLALNGASPIVRNGSAPHGQYVEARTASVFAGACHYNGELVTDGRSAVMSWRIDGGSFHGSDLSGVKMVAVVHCDENLSDPSANRSSEFVVDAPDRAVATAAVDWVKSQTATRVGTIAEIRRAPIAFDQDSDGFRVKSNGFVAMTVRPLPDGACCLQPNLVWYQPLMTVHDRRVGYTVSAECNATHLDEAWQRADENDAFYGSF